MKNKNTIIENAKQSILIESKTIANLVNFIKADFEKALNFRHHSKTRIIYSGIGKNTHKVNYEK